MYNKLMEIIDAVLLCFIIYIIGITVAIQCEYPITPCFLYLIVLCFFCLAITYWGVPLKLYRRNTAV